MGFNTDFWLVWDKYISAIEIDRTLVQSCIIFGPQDKFATKLGLKNWSGWYCIIAKDLAANVDVGVDTSIDSYTRPTLEIKWQLETDRASFGSGITISHH
jgi:hypothetical protein